jgi:hypothetical protein
MADDPKKPYGDVEYADPENGKYPIDTEEHARAALSYFSMPKNQAGYTPEQVKTIMGHIRGACKKFGIDVSSDEMSQRADGPVEERAATLSNVDFGERILTVVAVPYEQPTPVEFRGEMWREVFTRSAFNGFDPAKRRVPVSAVLQAPVGAGRPTDHGGGHLVGKVTATGPDRPDGLVLDMRISNTAAGDEALQLASDDALSPSVGFATRGGDHLLDRRTMTRRINRAFLDHVSLVPVPAYTGARVLAMRAGVGASAADLPRLVTPALDEYLADPIAQWAQDRLNRE